MVSGPRLEAPAGLLARWGIPADAELARAERGSNNQTFAVAHGGRRWVLRISQNLSADQARAEHRLLGQAARGRAAVRRSRAGRRAGRRHGRRDAGRARHAVPVDPRGAARAGRRSRAGAVRPGDRAAQPGAAPVAWSDAPQDWRGDPLRAHPDAPPAGELARALRARGRARGPDAGGSRRPPNRSAPGAQATAADLPVQVVHGDLGASNALVDERTGEMSGVLDFELAGPDARVQDLLVALLLSGALAGPGWARRAAALVRGYAAVLCLGPAEIMAVPDLLVVRCVASVFWRAAGGAAASRR